MILRADEKSGVIELDDMPLAGVLQSLSVNGEIVIDSNNSEGNGAPQKTMRGYKDKVISMTLRIVPTEEKSVYSLLEELEQLFMDKEDKVPKVMTLFNPHTLVRRIDEVVFTGFSSSEDNSTDTITVTLNFEEFIKAKFRE